MKRSSLARMVAVAWLVATPGLARADSPAVGKVLFARGAVSAQQPQGAPRLLDTGAALLLRDTVVTAGGSFALLQLNDGSRFTLRPDSRFVVEHYAESGPAEGVLLGLLRGGLRILTGAIGKRNPDSYRIKTPVATIGIRGTEFDARLCEKDCAEEERRLAQRDVPPVRSRVIGRLLQSRGTVAAVDNATHARPLRNGASVLAGDTIVTGPGAWGVVVFTDGSRMTVQPNSRVSVEQYRYEAKAGSGNSFIVNMLLGGLRLLTGAIGKTDRENYRVRTPVATIGIRGTGFDTYYRNPAWYSVWQGEIGVDWGKCSAALSNGKSARLPDAGCKLVPLAQLPDDLRNLPGPRPDSLSVDMDDLFGVEPLNEILPGLYVHVQFGDVVMLGAARSLGLGPGETGLGDSSGLRRIDRTPRFITEDIFPRPGEVDPKLLELFGLLGKDGKSGPEQCEVR